MAHNYVKSPSGIRQSETAECLLASLAIFLDISGHYYPLQQYRSVFPGYSSGANLADLKDIADRLGIGIEAYHCDLAALRNFSLPCILHLTSFHFVVLYKVEKNQFFIADPELGAYRLGADDLANQWSGNAVALDLSTLDLAPLKEASHDNAPLIVPKPGKRLVSALIGLNALILVVSIGATLAISQGIDRGYAGNGLWFIALFCVFSLIGNLLAYAKGIVLARASSHGQRQSVLELTRNLLEKPLQFHLNRHRSSLLTANRMFELEARLQHEKVDKIYIGLVVIVGLLLFSLVLNFALGLVLLAGFFCFALVRRLFSNAMKWTTLYANVARSRHLLLFQTVVDNALGLKFASRTARILAELYRKSEILRASALSSTLVLLRVNTLHNLVRMFEYALITAISLYQISQGAQSTGVMFAFYILRYLLDVRYAEMMPVVDAILANRAGLEAAKTLTGAPPEFAPEQLPTGVKPQGAFNITARDLNFWYKPNSPILTDINLTLEQGDFLVVRGESGSGKSTLLRILAGLIPHSSGDLSYCGIAYDDDVKHSLRRLSAIITQEEEIYEGNIIDNISYFDLNTDRNEIRDACKAAQLHDQITKLPMGYGTMISNAGTNLSGGQRQRLMLARIFFQDPDVIFLDEATSQIDGPTEALILDELKARKKTIIFASHSDDVEKHATKVLRLD